MKSSCGFIAFALFASINAFAMEGPTYCADLEGQWQAPDGSHSFDMTIENTGLSCGENCVILKAKYSLTDGYFENGLYCSEAVTAESGTAAGPRPMVLAFENRGGGHSIASYVPELQQLWAGVIPTLDGKQIPRMDSYWYRKTK